MPGADGGLKLDLRWNRGARKGAGCAKGLVPMCALIQRTNTILLHDQHRVSHVRKSVQDNGEDKRVGSVKRSEGRIQMHSSYKAT